MKRGVKYNRRYLRTIFLALLLLNSTVATLFSQSDRKHVREGNRDYRSGRYGDSELAYRRATEIPRGTPDAWFNLGNSIYRQQRFEDAAESFLKNASLDDNPVKRANSFYNLGNSLLSADRIEESIEAYKNSLRLNPDNAEAKFNLAYAQDMLRKQQEQNESQGDGEDNQESDQNKKDQESGDQDKNSNQDDSSQQEKPDQQQMFPKEDARRLLEALAENEKQLQEKVKKDKAAAAMVRILRNW